MYWVILANSMNCVSLSNPRHTATNVHMIEASIIDLGELNLHYTKLVYWIEISLMKNWFRKFVCVESLLMALNT